MQLSELSEKEVNRRHMKLDVEMLEANAYPPPSPLFHRSSFRLLRRQLISNRRYLIFLAIFLSVLLVTYQSTNIYKLSGSTTLDPLNVCNPSRLATTPIPLPPKPDADALTKVWKNLKVLFDQHAPLPSEIPKPKHSGDNDFPSKEKLAHILNITEGDATQTRLEHAAVLRHIPPYPRGIFAGRGIVMLAGGRYSEYAATALTMLREVGSQLPVEVWMKNSSEEKAGWCTELKEQGMACRMLEDYIDMSLLPHPYQWKIFTMLFSSFQEVLFLDADDIPLRNPDYLFESNVYKKTGAILWPDYWLHTGSPLVPYIIAITDKASDMLQDEKTVESGQVVWDKRRHWRSLLLAVYYNYYGPKFYYTLISQGWSGWGDKDTFPIALKAYGEEYYSVPHGIQTIFVNGTIQGIAMVQSDPTNETFADPLFLHSNIVKWSVSEFLCVGCSTDAATVGRPSALENPQSPIQSHLKDGKRIFSMPQFEEKGIDPEPKLWKCMERTACRTVWGNAQLCTQTREHMSKVFGFRFNNLGDKVCVVDP